MQRTVTAIAILLALLLAACATDNTALVAFMERKAVEYRQRNEQLALSMGERNFDAPKAEVMRAIIIALANKNMSVTNLDKEMGFVTADGHSIIDPMVERQIYMKDFAECKQEYPDISQKYTPGMLRVRITGTVSALTGKTCLAKVGVTSANANAVQDSQHKIIARYNSMYPGLTAETYRVFWEAVDKALFIQEGTK